MNKTLLEKQGQTHVIFSYGPLHMDVPVLVDQQELIYKSSVQTQDVVWKSCQERWVIGLIGEKESEKSLLA